MVKNLFKNGTDFLFKKQANILSAAAVIAITVLLSKFLGLVKLRLLTDRFSVSDLGVFWAAFRLPDMIFNIVVMGALTAAFIPVFTSYLSRDKGKDADEVASTILNLSTIVSASLSVLFFIFAGQLVDLVAPGLSRSEMQLAVAFTRIMLIGQTLPLVLGNFLTGILQSHKRFLLPALAPVVYNLGIIIGIVFLSPSLGLYGAVWGVALGAVLFLLIQLPLASHVGFHYSFKINLGNPGVREVGRLIVPRALGLAANQLNYTVNLIISSLISSRAIAIFNFAQQLEQLPVTIFAATIAQAALPTLSEEQDKEDGLATFKKTFLTSFHQILFLVLPSAAILIVLRIPIVRLVYGASKFDWPATVETGRTLAFLGLGVMAESLAYLVTRGFFALRDSRTPVILGAVSVGINIILSIILVPYFHLPVWGLGLAMTVADTTNAVALIIFLNRKVNFSPGEIFLPAVKMGLAGGLTGLSLYIPLKLLDQLVFDTTHTVPLLMLTGIASVIGLSVYFFLTWLLDIKELASFIALITKARKILFAAEEAVSEAASEEVPTLPETIEEMK